jgi:hypothetical protein
MADPRATARQWLADTMCADLDIDLDKPSCRGCLEKADAIVNHPGVTISFLTGPAEHWGPGGSLCIGPDLETRIAIMLPAEEGTGT